MKTYLEKLKARDIMVKNVLVVDADEIVGTAKLRMLRHGVGGLPVIKRNKLVGIITLRDIELAGKEVISLKIKDLMTKDVITVKPDTGIKEIIRIMKERGIQRIPVVEKKKVVGIVTQSCIINSLIKYL